MSNKAIPAGTAVQTPTEAEVSTSSPTCCNTPVSGRFYNGRQFQRNPDSESGIIILVVTNSSKHAVELGSYGWKSKKWLSVNLFYPLNER